ncbi:MAG: hypothetical protein QXD11_00450 [Candidatus Micrarchaeaceae archaeon]
MRTDDEIFLSLAAAKMFASGINPYTLNFDAIEFQNFFNSTNQSNYNRIVPSFTTNNKIAGTVQYPALSFLILVPFFLIGNNIKISLFSLTQLTIEPLLLFLLFFSILLIVLMLDKELLKKPTWLLAFFISSVFIAISSYTYLLFFILLILAYKAISSKYLFLLLGIIASFQELTWVAILLFIAYIAGEYGIKRSFYTALGTFLVFFIINSYFILLSPYLFFESILSTIQFILPLPFSFGYLLLYVFPIPLAAFKFIFILTALICMLVVYYTHDKRLIGLLSLVPLLVMYRAIITYYSIFLAFFAICLIIDINYTPSYKKTSFKKKILFYSFVLILLITIVGYTYIQHNNYQKIMNLQIKNGTILHENGNTLFIANLHYNLTKNMSLYLYTYGMQILNKNTSVFIAGLGQNTTILQNSSEAIPSNINSTNYFYAVNSNRFDLSGQGDKKFELKLSNTNVTLIRCYLYNQSLFYISPKYVYNT